MRVHRLTVPEPFAGPVEVTVGDDVVRVVAGADDRNAVLVSGAGRPAKLDVVDIGSARVAVLPPAPRRLVLADRFDSADLDHLRSHQWCGIDRSGQVFVAARDLSITVERAHNRSAGSEEPSVARLKGRAAEKDAAGVRGAVTARLTQLLLEEPRRSWRPSDLAAEDGRATIATASRLLAELRRLGLCTMRQDRQSRHYLVLDAELLLRWLAERTPPPDRRAWLDGYVRVESVDKLLDHVIDRLPPGAVLTGSAAAYVETRSVTTGLPVVTVRVDPTYGLERAAAGLRLQTVGRGGNVRLISDRGYLGTSRSREVRRIPLAGVVRTWLDVRQEPRGEDAAALYYDKVLDTIQPRGTRVR